jgi:hypothetical protein
MVAGERMPEGFDMDSSLEREACQNSAISREGFQGQADMLRRINKDLGKPAIAKATGRKRERMPSMAKFNRLTSTTIS